MMSASYAAPPGVKRFQQRALIVGAVFTVLLALGFLLDRRQFFHSYLFAFSFWAGISIGSLALLMLQHLTGGGWGLAAEAIPASPANPWGCRRSGRDETASDPQSCISLASPTP